MADIDAWIAEVEQCGLFDAEWYAAQYPDVAMTGLDPLIHFVRYGLVLKRDPGPDFDTRFYLQRYPDIGSAGMPALLHYIRHGRQEGRLGRRVTRVEMAVASSNRPVSAADDATWSYRVATDAFSRRGLDRLADIAIVATVTDDVQWSTILSVAANIGRAHDLFLFGAADLDFADIAPTTASVTLLGGPDAAGQAAALATFAGKGGLSGYSAALLLCPTDEDAAPSVEIARWADGFCADADWGIGTLSQLRCDLPLDPSTDALLQAAGLAASAVAFAMPHGRAIWIKPLLARIWRAVDDGEPLPWHAAMTLLGAAAAAADMRLDAHPSPPRPTTPRPFKAVAFYLPQYHPIAENDRWWGKGFTEWRNVVQGRPLFEGHDQPRRPADLGYYDLRVIETQAAQAALARQFGIHGFCYHYYWFEGRKLLNRPIEQMLASPQIDLPFCVCWANENWSRNWDGQHLDVLLEQTYSLEGNVALIRELIPMMRDPRWIRYGGKPVMLVYRIGVIPNWRETARLWREECQRAGLGDIHLCAVRFELEPLAGQPADHGLDAYVMFPPHEAAVRDARPDVRQLDPAFAGDLSSYDAVVDGDLSRFADGYDWPVHRGAMLRWDNMARRGTNSRIFHGASPLGFRRWIKGIATQEAACHGVAADPGETLMFINAWNEWAEGTYLEPDQAWGDAALVAFRSAVEAVPGMTLSLADHGDLRAIGQPFDGSGMMKPTPKPHDGRRAANPDWPTLLVCAHISGHQLFGGERSLVDVLEGFALMPVNIILTLPSENHDDYVDHLRGLCVALYAFPYPQWMDDRAPYMWLTLDFATIILRHGVDVVHANTIVLLEPLIAARMLGRTTVVHARELVTLDPALQQRMGRSAGEIVATVQRRADWVIGNSRATCALYGQAGRALYVPNAVTVGDFAAVSGRTGPIRFGMVSSNIASKGIADFAEVARRTAALTDTAHFVIVGPRTDMIDEWLAEIESGSRPANLAFLGYRDHPRDAMAELDILLNLSTFGESFGRTVAEAMAARRPVIAYHWGALPELVDHGETGWLLPFRDLDAVVDRIVALCGKPDIMAPMGERGRAKIAAYFSQPALQSALHAAYDQIMPKEAVRALPAPPVTIIVSAQQADGATLRSCLDHLLRHSDLGDRRIVVLAEPPPGYPGTQIIFRPDMTIGAILAERRGEDVVIVDPAVLARPRWLDGLRAAARHRSDVGIAIAVGRYMVDQVQVPDHGDVAALHLLQALADAAPALISSAPATCVYLRREALAAVSARLAGLAEWNDMTASSLIDACAAAGWALCLSPWSVIDVIGSAAKPLTLRTAANAPHDIMARIKRVVEYSHD